MHGVVDRGRADSFCLTQGKPKKLLLQ